jgi:hypothetical protein
LALVPGVLVAVTYLARRQEIARLKALYLLPLAWSGALVLLYVLRLPAPYQHGRYIMPALPPFIVIGVVGTLLIARWRPQRLLARALARVAALTPLFVFPIFWLNGIGIFARDVAFINSDMVVAARWVEANIPPRDLLAVHDIGAVGFFASTPDDPRPILDIAGLVTPETIQFYRDPAGILDLMRARGVRYLMVLAIQWEEMWLGKPEQWAGGFCLRFNAGGGMGGMRIYEFVGEARCN